MAYKGATIREDVLAPGKRLVVHTLVLAVLVVALALGLSATAFAGVSGSFTLVPNGPSSWLTGLSLVGAASNWEACLTGDGDTSYVWSSASPTDSLPWDMYALTDPVPVPGTAVTKVTTYARMRATALSATPPSYNMALGVGGSTWASGIGGLVNSTKYATYSREWGGGFSWAQIADLHAGIILWSPTGSPLDQTRCTRVWAVVEYATPVITSTAGLHGWVSLEGAVDVEPGADYTVNIYPSAGYHIDDVVVDGASQGAISSYTFEDVMASHTLHATFALDWGSTLTRPGLRR